MNKHSRVWSLQEAKAKFSEVVRLAHSEGPQLVTVHGQPSVEIIAAPPPAKVPTAAEMLAAFQACPVKDFEIPRIRTYGKHRDFEF